MRGGKARGASSDQRWRLLITALGQALSESPHLPALCQGGIKEEDTQSGFSLGPDRQRTQKTALTAAEGDSGGGDVGKEREER